MHGVAGAALGPSAKDAAQELDAGRRGDEPPLVPGTRSAQLDIEGNADADREGSLAHRSFGSSHAASHADIVSS